MPVLAVTATTWILVVSSLSVVVLALIVLAPWRRVRSEPRRLDEDVETRLLLGEDPAALAEELDARAAQRAPVAKLRRDDD